MTHTYTTVATKTEAEAAIYDGICQRISREFAALFDAHTTDTTGDAADGFICGMLRSDRTRSVLVRTTVETFYSASFQGALVRAPWQVKVHVSIAHCDPDGHDLPRWEYHSYTVSPGSYGQCSDGTLVPLFFGVTPFSDEFTAMLPATTTETAMTTETETETTETPARATAEQVQTMYARLETAVAGIRLPREMEWVVRAIPGEISVRVEATGRRYRDYDYGFVIGAHRVWTLGRLEQAAFDDLVDEARSWNFDAEFEADIDADNAAAWDAAAREAHAADLDLDNA